MIDQIFILCCNIIRYIAQLLGISYSACNILIFLHCRNESNIINNEISNIVQNIILSLSLIVISFDKLTSGLIISLLIDLISL